MSGPILTTSEMRAAEQRAIDAGSPIEALMARAGAAVAEAVWRFGGGQPALILCGPGNNGGDGYVAARLLAERGLSVRVAALGEPRTPAARAARAAWAGAVERFEDAEPAPFLVDALFGVGLSRPLDAGVADRLAALQQASRFTLAVDVPSGVATDDGTLLGASVAAQLTLALGALKPCHLLQPAAALCGTLRVGEIGIDARPSRLAVIGRPQLRAPGPADHKYSRGYALIVGGAMPGASLLAAEAAMRSGAGYVALAGPQVGRRGPHALVRHETRDGGRLAQLLQDERIGAVAIGPGLGRDDRARDLIEAALASDRPLVLDADALTLLGRQASARLSARGGPMLLTPHEGEFARLFGSLGGSKVDRARHAAEATGAVVLLKGADTVLAAPDGRAAMSRHASTWLASAGTGDVLAGIAAARIAADGDVFRGACEAVWLHADAARRAGPALIADDLVEHLAAAVTAAL